MIKVCAGIASVGFLVLAGGAGCSSASTPDDGDGGTTSTKAGTSSASAGSGTVVPSGGSGSSEGGTGSQPTAGSNSSGGTGSATAGTGAGGAGGTGGTGGTGVAPGGAACKSIKTGMACMPEGQDCPDLKCGLADSGTRSCLCQGTWMCQACDFSMSPFKDKPDPLPDCTNQVDKLECPGMDGSVCMYPGGEACACAADDEGALIWDCDKPPTSWAAPAM